jgi:hypothetical protein
VSARLDTSCIAVGSVWRGPSGFRYRVIRVARGGVELVCLDVTDFHRVALYAFHRLYTPEAAA